VNGSLSPQELSVARRLWSEAGLSGTAQPARLPGGANNRVYRLRGGEQAAILKIYYRGPGDSRDRFRAEVEFSYFLAQHGLTEAPRPYARDEESGMALFEFLPGRKLKAGEVTKEHVRDALEFVLRINEHRASAGAAILPPASEACFSVAEHLACVERRVERLAAIGEATAIDRDARRFVGSEVSPAWERLRSRVGQSQSSPGVDDHVLSRRERCLSPSDFGFHNAILDEGGRLRFFDFEYAGWDDPAKMVCDFFCQVEVPAPPQWFQLFATTLADAFPKPEAAHRRIEALLPVYRLKWCCILLNEFVPHEARRRRFSRGERDATRKAEQLSLAREMLQRLENEL
jgi:hypothetical protein